MGRFLSDIARSLVGLRPRNAWRYLPETVAIVIAVSAVPMVAGWVPPNPYYGFRTPDTMASPEEWHSANRLMGSYMIASQIIAISSVSSVGGAMISRFGSDRVTWGVLWSCTAALIGIGAGVVHYYSRV